ncbi:protein cortex isoform X1 [Sitodiplosis mosellana]|nr:protein cortex isoform X1 [Sitodiplosis mosellana]
MSDSMSLMFYGIGRTAEKSNGTKVSKASNVGKFQVKKRAQYENEVIKCESKLEAIPISYGDRFIPRRYFRKQTPSLSTKAVDENENDIFVIHKKPFYWRLHNYQLQLGMQLGLSDSGRLLNFFDATTQQACDRTFNMNPLKTEYSIPSKSTEALDWPCKPRAKPLSYNDSTHDMPGFDDYMNGHNIIDWSSQGQIAASFDSSLVLWGPPTASDKETSTVLYELKHVRALKYSPDGNLLGLGVNNSVTTSLLQLWDISDKMSIYTKNACILLKERPLDSIRCIEWESTAKRIICGMSSGLVFVISYPQLQIVYRYDVHRSTISNIKYSINNTFIAATDSTGNLSVLRNNANFEVYLKNRKAHYIAWHPWIETNLLIGYKSPASIHLLDLKTKTTIAHYRRTDLQYSLCAISMNPLSAELVASFSHQVNDVTHSDIMVLASMNRIVDNISAHQDSVYYILWDPTGTKVATAGQDESLNIWHFFGKSQRKADELRKINDNIKIPKNSKLNLDNAFIMFR